jgi:hypothetical protein
LIGDGDRNERWHGSVHLGGQRVVVGHREWRRQRQRDRALHGTWRQEPRTLHKSDGREVSKPLSSIVMTITRAGAALWLNS